MAFLFRWQEDMLRRRNKMQKGQMSAAEMEEAEEHSARLEQERFEQLERRLHNNFRQFNERTDFKHRRLFSRVFLFMGFYLWIMLVMSSVIHDAQTDSIHDKPDNKKLDLPDTHYNEWNLKRTMYFNESEKSDKSLEK